MRLGGEQPDAVGWLATKGRAKAWLRRVAL